MGITLISPVTSRAAETSEPTMQATTESASTETTTEVPVTTEVQVAPSEDVLFDHFYDTGILPATLQSKDFSSCELLVAADPIIFTKNTTVLSAYNGVYLLRFSSPEEAMYAYSYYYDKVELIDINAVIFQTSDDEHYEEVQADLSDLNQGDDALSEASTLPDVDLKKNTIALVDTGCEGTNVTQSVSVLGGESKDDNGHGTRMYDVIVEENPDAEILSIKALDKDGKAQVSDIYAAITYAVDNKADIINLSISAMATRDSAIVEDAIKDAVNKGITVVGAAGNAGRDARFYVPGKIDEAVIVGACDENGEKIKISNFGQSVDFNVTASSTSEATARFSGIVSKDGMDGLKINEEKIFATDYVVATSTDAEKTTEASETLTTETVTTEATESATTEREESATSESLTTEENAVDTTVETTEVSTRTDADGSKWDIKGLIDNYSDTGEQALSVTGYISINGRGFYVGDPVSNPKWRDLKSLEGFVRKLFEKTIPVMREAIANIKSVSDDETCNLGVCYKEILDDIDISSDIGTKLYEFACKQAENRSCTKLELLFEVLDMAGFINKLCLDSKKKEIPDYAVKNCERKIGKIFDSKVCREVFGW
jgi:hypothetical protein